MSISTGNQQSFVWKESVIYMLLLGLSIFGLIIVYYDSLSYMVEMWDKREEYGHGYIIPAITAFLIWQKKDLLENIEFTGSWTGALILLIGVILFYMGELSSIYTLIQYGFFVALVGIVFSLTGYKAYKVIAIPILILVFMIPLPNFFLNNLSSQLQLVSSQLGVFIIRLFDISVYLEGNVIDLGVYKLQVVEACSGLNYLFPLMTLAFISAYFFTGAMWKKSIIFISSIPITIFMNSLRIGMIGVTVEYWGIEMADGVLHDFEGWAVFMSCIVILVAEMWVLAQIGKDKLPLREAFGLDFPEPAPEDAEIKYRDIPRPFYASLAFVALVALSSFALPERTELIPDRKNYAEFPLAFDQWKGRTDYLTSDVLDALKLTDYLMVNYQNVEDMGVVNFYSAYYESQQKGASAHSPRSCIPGGGWRITSLEDHTVNDVSIDGVPLIVNRLVIQKDNTKQLVYYWFQQRGRIVTNEYLMKWYLFWDSATLSRTDGALMRLTTVLKPGQDISVADERLESFVKEVAPLVPAYVPGK